MREPTVNSAAIIGWGKCLPPAVLTNADMASFLETSDEWITSRTGIRERRISHVGLGEIMYVAGARALACAGLGGSQLELIIAGTTSYDDQVPNVASGIQRRVGADGCAAMDINTACTSFMYSLSTATAMIRSGVVKNALVLGGEVISPFIDWTDRNTAVLFGDGAGAVVLQATDSEEGCWRSAWVLRRVARDLGCMAWAPPMHTGPHIGKTSGSSKARNLQEGRAWHAMAATNMAKAGKPPPTWTWWYRTRQPAHHRSRCQEPACPWTRCSSTCSATATCPQPPYRWASVKRWKKAA